MHADKPAANDAPRLGADLLYLLERLPRDRWPAEAAHGTAGVWQSMHASLRHGQQRLEALARQWQDKAVDWVGFRKQALPLLDAHLGHLHGHHGLEDQHYFPAMRRAEPRMVKGFDLLAADHERIDASVHELQRLRIQLAHASPVEAAAWQCAHDMARGAADLRYAFGAAPGRRGRPRHPAAGAARGWPARGLTIHFAKEART